ncbi:TetR family transcriptional regulator [Bradyrhizobium sp. HKCCYLR20261]|uniref:TetR family transcriptional regulator n=1 Tax=unclassified Bradyrhizobium TaxID=2631580 RepID=UPI003EC01E8B
MAGRRVGRGSTDAHTGREDRIARLAPSQQRSRARFEQILACAVELMAEKGSDALKMSDIVERTGIGFGSLYQYFPDKTAVIATLAERYNAIGRDCVRKELTRLETLDDLQSVLGRITDSYYHFFIDEPVVRDIWHVTQADRALQALDAEDFTVLTGLLIQALQPFAPQLRGKTLDEFCQLMMVLIAAAVRHAVTLPPKDGRRALARFKQLLPRTIEG